MQSSDHRRQLVAGSVAGAATVAALYPLDVIKTRLQVHDALARLRLVDVVKKMWRTRSFYAGVLPAMLGGAAAWGSYLYSYSWSKRRRAGAKGEASLTSMDHLLSGMEAGAAVAIVTNPVWVLKTRLQLQDSGVSGVAVLKSIVREEGVAALYRGLLPSLLLVSHGAIQMTVYERLKQIRVGDGDGGALFFTSRGVSGALAKATATVATYPLQVLRSRMQQGMESRTLKYRGVVSSARLTLQREGLRGLYKGLGASILRNMPSSAITFFVYEFVLASM